jgi:KaiC/GvpD/RAD55 family RecA-like ATPase
MSDIEDKNIEESKKQLSEKLKNDIQKEEPNFDFTYGGRLNEDGSPKKIVPIKPLPDISKILPISNAEIISTVVQPIDYVVYPCLPTQGIGFIYAATGIGKTRFTLNLAYAIAAGGAFLKYKCPKPRKVLYVDGEMAFNELHQRYMAVVKQQGPLHFSENFSFLTPDKIIPFKIPKIDTEEGQQVYLHLIEKYGFEVIIFDSLSRVSSFDENRANEWRPIEEFLLYLKSIGKTIIIVHHAGKEKNGYRGTSIMMDCANFGISLQAVVQDTLEEDRNWDEQKIKIEYQKTRGFSGQEACSYEISLKNESWTYRSVEQTDLDKVIERLNINMTQAAIAKELGFSQPKVSRLIKKARFGGLFTFSS